MTMLVVDNNDSFCRDLIHSLTLIDKKVLVAYDHINALCLIAEKKPDKVVLERYLKDSSGLDLIKPILKIDETIKIIVLSRYGSIADAVMAIKLGAFNYLPKPINAQALIQSFQSQSMFDDDGLPKTNKKPMSIKRFEWEYINTVLANKKGNISATARELGLDRRTLQRKLKKYPHIK